MTQAREPMGVGKRDHIHALGRMAPVAPLRARGLTIGSTTGYSSAMMAVLLPEAAQRGYRPDVVVCLDDVASGRPDPWMAFRNLERLSVPFAIACVKVGDTVPDVQEGINAALCTVGIVRTGNEIGPSEAELAATPPAVHYVVDSLADVPAILDEIEDRLCQGECP